MEATSGQPGSAQHSTEAQSFMKDGGPTDSDQEYEAELPLPPPGSAGAGISEIFEDMAIEEAAQKTKEREQIQVSLTKLDMLWDRTQGKWKRHVKYFEMVKEIQRKLCGELAFAAEKLPVLMTRR